MINTILGCCPREGYGLHPSGGIFACRGRVVVPVRGAGCITDAWSEAHPDQPVAVPVRGAGCIGVCIETGRSRVLLLSP